MTDVTKLDWRRWYGDRRKWPHSRKLFLADAALKMAPLMFFPWDDIIPPSTMADAAPLLPGPYDAFNPDGSPRSDIHAAWAPALLNYMSAAEYTSRRMQHDDPEAWMAAQIFDPLEQRMVFNPAKAYATGLDVSFDHWNYAAGEAAEVNELRGAGVITMPMLARAITEMALQGDIKTYARSIDDGEEVLLDPDDWQIDDAAPRLASCGINLGKRRSTTAEPTHLLFIDPNGFDVHAWLYAERHMISLLDEGITPRDVGVVGPKRPAMFRALVNKAFEILQAHMQAHPTNYQRPALRAALEDKMDSVSDGVFEHARNLLREKHPHIKEGGAPAGTNRSANRRRFSVIDGGRPND